MHGMKISKSGRNDFAKYNYMELGDFLIPTQTIFAEIGLCGVVSFSKDIATLTITDVDDGSELVLTSPMGSAALKGCHEVQNVGAVETYQRRYLWVSAMEIVEHDVIDSSKPKDDAASLNESISILKRATTVDSLNAYWKAEVTKFDPKSADYKSLKTAATERKSELQELEASNA